MDKITLSNVGTYKEIEYLKKSLGPVLVSACSELCLKRPTDPIEYLGNWLLKWRYNEELKRRDMGNALEVIRQRQTAKCEKADSIANAQCKLELDPYGQGVIPNYPFLPPGYGGPVTDEDLQAVRAPTEEQEEEQEFIEYEMPGEDYSYQPERRSLQGQEYAGEDGGNNYYGSYDPNQMADYQQQYQEPYQYQDQGQDQYQQQEQYEQQPEMYPSADPNQVATYDTNTDPGQSQPQ